MSKNKHRRNLNRAWHITSWTIEWIKTGIAIVGFIYDHPQFRDGDKVYVKIKAKRIYKYVM